MHDLKSKSTFYSQYKLLCHCFPTDYLSFGHIPMFSCSMNATCSSHHSHFSQNTMPFENILDSFLP